MPWHARLSLDYQRQGERTVLQHSHDGPLRIFKSLYPEGDAVCHNVIVHPPGGLVGGDVLDIGVQVGAGAHALISTPGATRFYRQRRGPFATQQVRLTAGRGRAAGMAAAGDHRLPRLPARQPLERHPGRGRRAGWPGTSPPWACPVRPSPTSRASSGSGWRFPAAGWSRRASTQHDRRLLDSPLGLGGQRCLGTLVFATGTPAGTRAARAPAGQRCAKPCKQAHMAGVVAGATCPNDCWCWRCGPWRRWSSR